MCAHTQYTQTHRHLHARWYLVGYACDACTITVYDMYKILRQKEINMMYNAREFVANRYIIKFERYLYLCVYLCIRIFERFVRLYNMV